MELTVAYVTNVTRHSNISKIKKYTLKDGTYSCLCKKCNKAFKHQSNVVRHVTVTKCVKNIKEKEIYFNVKNARISSRRSLYD